jgi:hypothetical protein
VEKASSGAWTASPEIASPASRRLDEAHAPGKTLTDALGSALFYAGVATALGGLLNLIRPLHWAGIHSRRRGSLVAAAGLALAVGASEFRMPTRATAARDTLIDRWLPEWQFRGVPRAARSRQPATGVCRGQARSVIGHFPVPDAHDPEPVGGFAHRGVSVLSGSANRSRQYHDASRAQRDERSTFDARAIPLAPPPAGVPG